ncbi:hypothetical protein Taro_034309 [Colocasia esculenta]|uniref:RRM domain-containing protein n=1 Tax=Colocasia esculenta TaxID=4460 RepID=A0A843VXH0_COLES|nr:hypothetical protein [Colocasia esculenta]
MFASSPVCSSLSILHSAGSSSSSHLPLCPIIFLSRPLRGCREEKGEASVEAGGGARERGKIISAQDQLSPDRPAGKRFFCNAMDQASNYLLAKGLSSIPSRNVTPTAGASVLLIPSKPGPDPGLQSADSDLSDLDLGHRNVEVKNSMDDLNLQGIGKMLPDDEEELLAGIMDDFDLSELPSQVEDLEDYDVFGYGGGMELDCDVAERLNIGMAKASIGDSYVGDGSGQYGLPNSGGSVAGEHPYGEHPSRTLFVRNINSNVEDSELRSLFEQYGDIRTLYTACKHRGFVMISYYDIRAARTAMRALQNKPLRRRKLDIHFSIPKDNPSDKDINQGTLVIFNLDPSVSTDELHQIFGTYGEVKEIRETPHKHHHKFIEFYDVRAAEAALQSLNRIDIAGKRIKLEPSRPGGTRRSLLQLVTQELEQDETRSYRQQIGSPITNSPPGMWTQLRMADNSHLPAFGHSSSLGAINSAAGNQSAGLASILPSQASNPIKIVPIGKEHRRSNHVANGLPDINVSHGTALQHSLSFPDPNSRVMINTSQTTGITSTLHTATTSTTEIETMTGSQFLWGSPKPYSEHGQSSTWAAPAMEDLFKSDMQVRSFPHSDCHGSLLGSSHYGHHHVGSAPSIVSSERFFSHFPESSEIFRNSVAFGGIGMGRKDGNIMMSTASQATISPGFAHSISMTENGSPNFRMMPMQIVGPIFHGSPYSCSLPGNVEGLIGHGHSRRVENSISQLDMKKQYRLDLEKVISGEDTRTTLMIKNIPNKYTSKMLLAAIDETHKGTYDFFYLPIDFKNKCNVGYAFINMVSTSHILSFYEMSGYSDEKEKGIEGLLLLHPPYYSDLYPPKLFSFFQSLISENHTSLKYLLMHVQAFNGKKWEKFNSEKVASLAYARIQGKVALVAHFQNSSLMNEDKRCRPIIFHSEGLKAGDQEFESVPFVRSEINFGIRVGSSPSTLWFCLDLDAPGDGEALEKMGAIFERTVYLLFKENPQKGESVV